MLTPDSNFLNLNTHTVTSDRCFLSFPKKWKLLRYIYTQDIQASLYRHCVYFPKFLNRKQNRFLYYKAQVILIPTQYFLRANIWRCNINYIMHCLAQNKVTLCSKMEGKEIHRNTWKKMWALNQPRHSIFCEIICQAAFKWCCSFLIRDYFLDGILIIFPLFTTSQSLLLRCFLDFRNYKCNIEE